MIKPLIRLMKRIIKFVLRGEIELEFEDTPSVPVPSEPTNPTTPELIQYLDWNRVVREQNTIQLTNGVTYLVPTYQTEPLSKDLLITCEGKCKIIFGKDFYNQWTETGEDQIIFHLGVWNNKVKIENVDLFTGKLIDQVEPYYRTLFTNSPEPHQSGTIELVNCDTNLEYGLLYSGSQDKYLVCKASDINFEGIIFQELKAKHGGGLLSHQRRCKLKQVHPITSVVSDLTLTSNTSFKSSVPFSTIQNRFIGFGNSCNILFVDGKTFYLPKTDELGNTHQIRRIPNVGERIRLESFESGGVRYLRTKEYELQSGDQLNFGVAALNLLIKDRASQDHFTNLPSENPVGYWIDFKPDLQNIPIGWHEFSVTKSTGLDILGRTISGHMIFKYNKNFQTNVDVDHGLDYMLASDAFGVLSYNNGEITVDYEDVEHDGFYRQSKGTGYSNGYRMVRCTGFGDQFNPPVQVITE